MLAGSAILIVRPPAYSTVTRDFQLENREHHQRPIQDQANE